MRRFSSAAVPGSEEWQAVRMHFLQAGRQSLTLRNPRIVSVLEVVDDGQDAWIAAEFVEGETLDALLKRVRIPAEQATYMLRSLALTLDQAHRSGVPHGDLKPSNIFVGEKRSLRIADFAISPRARKNTGGPIDPAWVHAYLSPEHFIAPATIGAKSDQYSLAAIAYLLYTGKVPFGADGGDPGPAILRGQVAMPSTVNNRVPTGLDAVLLKAMSRDPGQRCLNCVEFMDRLEAVFVRAVPLPPAESGGTSPKLMYAGLGSLVLALIVALALMISGKKKPEAPVIAKVDKKIEVIPEAPKPSPTGSTGRVSGPRPEPTERVSPGPVREAPPNRTPTVVSQPVSPRPEPHRPEPSPGKTPYSTRPSPPPPQPEAALPPPPGSLPGYSLAMFSRDAAHQIGKGISFPLRDPNLGEMGPGDLMAQVVLVGPAQKGVLSLECNLDGTTIAVRAAKPNSVVVFRDRPSPGTYRIILRQDDRVVYEHTFRITP